MAVYTDTIQLQDEVTPAAKSAQAAVSSLGDSLDAAKASALGASSAVAKAAPAGASGGAAAGAGAAGSGPAGDGGMGAMWANADHAAQVGKASITAAITSIKGAFTSLAQGDAKGAVTGLFDSVADLSKMLDLVVPGLGQLVSTVISIAGGIVGITAGLVQSGAQFAIQATQDKEAMLSMFDALGQGKVSGGQLDEMLSGLSDTIGVSKDKLAGLTKEFLKMGVTGEDQLKNLTLAAESANAIVGEGGAAAFTSLQKKIQIAAETGGKLKLDNKFIKGLGDAGLSIDDVAKSLGMTADQLKGASVDAQKLGDGLTNALVKKGAPALERLSDTWTEIKGKFMSNLGDMFEDLGSSVDPFMKEIKSLFEIFSQAQPSGQALKSGIMAFFSETLDLAKQLVPMVKHFLLDVIIFGLQAYIALKPTIAAVKEWLASSQGISAQAAAWTIVKEALIAIAVAIGIVVALFSVMAAATVLVGTAIWALIGGIAELEVQMVETLVGLVSQAISMGEQFAQGLVDGITSGAKAVTDSVSSLADSAVDTFKSALGIASPSKVGMELGGHFGSGLGIGIGAAANDVSDAASNVAGSAATGVQGASPSASSASTGAAGASVNITINIDGAGKSAEEITDEMVAAAWERYALAAGM